MRPSSTLRAIGLLLLAGTVTLATGIGLCAQTIVGPDQMNRCDQATFTTTITNASATQDACLLVISRSYTEAGVLYVPGSTTITLHDATVLTDDPTGGAWDIDALLGSTYVLPPNESITIAYDLETTCAALSGTEQVTVDFEDCADPGEPLQNTSSASIEILPGAIVVSKTPSIQDASVGDLVTWTITVENTGLGRVDNVLIADVLGPGLAYDSSTDGGSNAGQTTTWAIGSIPLGGAESVSLTAEVIACDGLYNDADAAFGCGPSDICFDTAVDGGTATASLNLLVDNPALSFTAPNVSVGYCTEETAGLIQIVNDGDGWARNGELCCQIAYLQVDPTRLPPGATYSGGCFQLPDIPPNSTFDLTFYVLHPDVDWCSGPLPSGDNVFQLTYANDCDIPFVAFPQFSSLSSEPGPSLAVTKTGPDSLRLGETGDYRITVEYVGSADCGGGSPGPVAVVDTYPEGFTVTDPAGGTVDGGARTIAWAYDPTIDPPFDETIQIVAPTDCGYCAQPGGGSDANAVTATGIDCCGCTIVGTAEADTTILCEGYGGVEYFSSSMALDREITVRCSMDYAVTVTHTYTFIDDPALDDFLLDEFTYFVDGNGDLLYATGSATITGATLGTVVDNTPAGRLELPLTDGTSVRNKTIVYQYTLIVQDLDSPSCQASTIPINAGIELDPGASAVGYCGTMYADPDALQSVTAQPPAMSVSIDGIPEVQEYCATYPVTITLTRTSAQAKPYDVRLVLTNNGGSFLDFSGADCGGGTHSPTDGTTCVGPIVSGSTYEWRYADLFDSESDTAQIVFDVMVPCSGPLADLSVVATFDDLCHDDAVYEDSCSTSASDNALLSLSANVFTRKSPEIVYATTQDVEWTLVVHNTGNGTAYNVWVDDTLGSGLVFDAANTVAPGGSVTANQDHLGNTANGATFLFDEVAPGELIRIAFAADLVGCENLTNDIAVSWGCGGADCQVQRSDDSIVVVPPANLVATTFSPTPVPMCAANSATAVVKNAGVSTVYGVVNTVTLPAGLVYLTGPPNLYPEVRVNGGAWSQTGEPTEGGQTLTWTSTETSELASVDPNDVIEIRFNYTAFCDFAGGNLSFQAGFEDPCGDFHTSNTGVFALGLTPADVSVTLRQTSPAPGESIDCGGQATWAIDVENVGSVSIPVVEVEAILGDGLTYISSQGDAVYGPPDNGANIGQSVTWEIENLPIGATATLEVTAASAGGGLDCEALDIDVDASWGCGDVDGDSATFDADCTTTFPASGTIAGIREPPLDLFAILSPDAIEACDDTTTLTLTIQNTSTVATTANVDIVTTLPDDLSYVVGTTEIDCGAGFAPAGDPNAAGQTLTWYDIGTEGGPNDACDSIPPGGAIRLRFDVAVTCYFATQNIPITAYFYDCCGLTQYDSSTQVPLTSLLANLTIDKSPANTTLDCYDAGDTVTWTITVQNTGTGIADWVRVVDTLGSALVLDASDSPTAGSGVPMGGDVVGWEIGPLAPGGTFTATVTAHAIQPPDDCSRTVRRNTAVATWGCGAFDGDPNTTAEATCAHSTSRQDQSTVRVPNLSISPSDITPSFTCGGDGITPGSGAIELVARNSGSGDGAITEDFAITLTETTTGYSVSDTFTNLGGTLPLNDDASQTLTFAGWGVSCTDCSYEITVTLDAGDTLCECDESDNVAVLSETITLPDLLVDSASLSVTCNADGQSRIHGPVTLRNDGCGDPLAGDVSVRLRLFDAADCTGNEIDTFTVDFTGLTIAAGGGTVERTIDVTRALDLCDTCVLSIRIEADENDSVCECNGTNNSLCAGTFSIATPDLVLADIDFGAISCTSDGISGVVRVTVDNTGCGASGPFDLRMETDGCLTFIDETVAALAAGASTTVNFAIASDWADCTDCACAFTATVDPDESVCECDGSNNSLSESYTSTLPDLEISGVVASIGCGTDGQATVDGDVTIANTGCADAAVPFDIRVTVYEDAGCSGNLIETWTETIAGETIAAGGSTVIPLSTHTLAGALCAGDCDYSARFEVDSGDDVCECDGTDNAFCLSAIPSEIPDLVVTAIDPSIDCRAGTATVAATVENIGCGDATGVVVRLTTSGCTPTIDSDPVDLSSGASQDVEFSYAPNCEDWNCTFIVTADPGAAICECDGANSLTLDPYPGIGSIGDRVWFDADAAGDQDPGELGIANVTVILEADLDGDGIIDFTAETTTDANGEYLFDDLPAGEYTITVDETTLPEGMAQTYDYDGLGTPSTSNYALAENEDNREQDFGYRGLGSIGDFVWFDSNGDGVQDPSEPGIENVAVTLEGDLNGDGIPETLTATTDADGLYLFEFLPAGPYTISIDDATLPDGLSQTYDYDGLGTPHTSGYTLGAGEHNREQDFGYATPALSVDKVIVDILRVGASIGNITGPVEPGDVIVYEFVIENVGPVPATQVGFEDTLPSGVVVETDAPGSAGSYVVSAPGASGSLALSDGAASFNAPLGVTVDAGETLTATFAGVVTSAASQGDDLTNTARAYGEAEDGTPIPGENVLVGDIADADEEDPDADDTGIVTVSVLQPALSVDKTITDIVRPGVGSLGISGPVEPGDTVSYRFVIRNVGGATAYDVEFGDSLPPGMEAVAGGTYVVTSPTASGSLGITAGAASIATSIDATIAGGESLTADFDALVTSDIVQGVDLVNTAEATGTDGFDSEIPDENAALGDTSDDDVEDPDADDTGIVVIGAEEPALSVDKIITGILRNGSSIGSTGPVEPGDVILYRYTIRNVGLGTAYAVGFADTLPIGLVTETDAPGDAGNWTVDDPSASGSLALPDSVGTITTSLSATIAGGGNLIANYAVFVTSDVEQGMDLINVAAAAGVDGAGNPIPGENADIGDLADDDAEDPDADDTGIAIIAPNEPALSVDKRIVDVIRGDVSLGLVDPILYEDLLVYQITIRNVGLGTAYDVEFTDTLPTGLEVEIASPGNAGGYVVDDPIDAGSLGLADGAASFSTSIDVEIAGGGTLTAGYTVLVTSDAPPSTDLVNVAIATGIDGAGTPIPEENPATSDTSDDDEEDPDADDSGIALIRVGLPALVTEKTILNVTRAGRSLGAVETVQSGDIVTYRLWIANVGDSTAFDVDIRDILPAPFVYVGSSTIATWPYRIGTYEQDPGGAPGPTLLWDTDATLAPDDAIVLRFDALVDGTLQTGETYTNVLQATGRDGADRPIPPNNAAAIPEDDDPDDRDDVSLLGGADVPALVTTKSVDIILRGGTPVPDRRIEVGDVVRYELTVRNVGPAAAYRVDISDRLPAEFSYLSGSASAAWPSGSNFADPVALGGDLLWNLDATLDTGDLLTLRFETLVDGPIFDGLAYRNTMQATGEDASGGRIPTDQRSVVPDDKDPDDASDASLIGRSEFVQGEGGRIIPVPILRKTAEVVGDGLCEAWTAAIDRLWFRTDIAMYASSEFEWLSGTSSASGLVSETLLPTWLRTVQAEGAEYALDNLLQVELLSSLGVGMIHAPLTLERATTRGLTPNEAVADRLAELALRVALPPDELPPIESWGFLEYAGGEPIYVRSTDTRLGPTGDWTVVEDQLVASALGMGLVKQSIEARTLLASDRTIDRYLGTVLADLMVDKIIALDEWLTIETSDSAPYVPHAHRLDGASTRFEVEDDASRLFDQLSLLWGLAEFLQFVEADSAGWKADLRDRAEASAERLLAETLAHVEVRHVAEDGLLLDTAGEAAPASTVDLGLLLASLDAIRSVGSADQDVVGLLLERAALQLASRQTPDGRFALGAEAPADATWSLTAQLAGIRGLLVAHRAVDAQIGFGDAAQQAFDALESGLWEDPTECFGFYASFRYEDQRARCYTPLDVGLAIGSLRELAGATGDPDRASFILTRMSRFVRVLVDEAAMQLSNAGTGNGQIAWGAETNGIAGLTTDAYPGQLAPVLQERLCIEAPGTDASCSGWRRSTDDPRYQTDLSMYAAFVIQDRLSQYEDVADANLAAVILHSRLGIPLAGIGEAWAGTIATEGLAPIAVPFYGGSPALISGDALDWQPTTFDMRIVGSALGMTLLREAQEIRQLLGRSAGDPRVETAGRILTESLLETIDALLQIRMDGPESVRYVPHSVRWDEQDATRRWIVTDARSTLFDQIALLWGLVEASQLLDDPRLPAWIDPSRIPGSEVADLIDSVFDTLERVHLDPVARVLLDEVEPAEDVWIRGDRVSTALLGLASSALEDAAIAFGQPSSLASRAVSLLDREVAFLDAVLWRGVGSYVEDWKRGEASPGLCEQQTLRGQLGALRALLAADTIQGDRANDAMALYRAIDTRFWDAELRLYRTTLDSTSWCATPLDLGLAVDAIDRAVALLDPKEASAARDRLAEHVDRLLDGADLQLPSSRGTAGTECLHYAPVFDRLVCLQPGVAENGAAWAEAGDLIRYRVIVENPTDEAFRDLVLTDTLPDGVSLVSAEPAGEMSGRQVAWTFDQLLPEETRSWTLLARADDDAAPGEILENCAVLTYTDAAGAPRPLREACARTEVDTFDARVDEQLRDLPVHYRTDEAMYLASVLDDLACQEAASWPGTNEARAISLDNLGILLAESGLGVPLRYSPLIPDDAFRSETLAEQLSDFAARAGLPRAPIHGDPIVLPFDEGMPVLDRGDGFIEKSAVITPAALGWTLVREVQFLEDCAAQNDALSTYLTQLAAYIIDGQLGWVFEVMDETNDSAYVPHEIRVAIAGDAIEYGVSDPRSTLYDQAALLIGLLRAAGADALSERSRRMAEQLAGGTFEQLALHWAAGDPAPQRTLTPEDDGIPLAWLDLAVAARALRSGAQALPQARSQAMQLLRRIAELAKQAEALDDPIEEAARLFVLVVAGDAAERAITLQDWDGIRLIGLDPAAERRALGPRSVVGWPNTPRQLGMLFELLAEVTAADASQRLAALDIAGVLLSEHVLADRVQLLAPIGYWRDHTEVPCFDLAPVFAVLRARPGEIELFDAR